MPFKIIRNDLVQVKADAIVNTANPMPCIMDGTDLAVYEAAGKEELLKERQKIGEILPGNCAVTPAFKLKAKYIIHTVGPVWINGEFDEEKTLASCYRNSLQMAFKLGCQSIAFPLISTGIYGYPKDKALLTAVSVISEFVLKHEMDVVLVVFDEDSFVLSEQLFKNVDSYIDEHYASEKRKQEYPHKERRIPFFSRVEEFISYEEDKSVGFKSCRKAEPVSLDDYLKISNESFQEKLFDLIDERGLSDAEVYHKANIDRKLFSKIRCSKDYLPKKKTILALAVALELNIDETEDLLKRAGLALSRSRKFDLIVQYFIENEIYDVYKINLALFQHHQSLL